MKPFASKDITYCTNKKCKQRKNCFRCLENYDDVISKDSWYWFTEFNEENCNNGYREE